ncbi:hypothetical protein F5X97DRAFT_298977 [Nemania serpens]|nr:hypothetical protein F5X97DRAFT_298977 [Nemania serpens]
MIHVASPRRQTYDRSPGRSQQRTQRTQSPDSGSGSESSGSLKRFWGRISRTRRKFRSFGKGNRSSALSIVKSSNADALEPQNRTSLFELPADGGHSRLANTSKPRGGGNAADRVRSIDEVRGIDDSYNASHHSITQPSRQERRVRGMSGGLYTLPRQQQGLHHAEFDGNEQHGGGHQIVGSLVLPDSILGSVTDNHLYRENVFTRDGAGRRVGRHVGNQYIGQYVAGGNTAAPFSGRFTGNRNYGLGCQVVGVGFSEK